MVFQDLIAPEDYGRLGLSQREGPFKLSDVGGKLLIVEFFNQHCLTCRRQAPSLESFFQNVLSGDLADRVRLLTVGVGNRTKGLLQFRQELELTYPVAPDPFFERYMELGDPGGTPFTAFLLHRGGRWVLADFHLGMQGDTELVARSRVFLEGRTDLDRLEKIVVTDDHRPPLGLDEAGKKKRAQAFLARVAGDEVSIDAQDLPGEVRVYRALGRNGAPKGLYARIVSRDPVCDVCHAIHFLLAFDNDGRVRGFEPIHVTKYGNEVWGPEDNSRMDSLLSGRELKGLAFDPDVDAVTSATMSSALIFDEARRTAPLLAQLRNQ
jgi:thiol-disulfide isomerase/thioredoxin